jgi:filamentous hemagglutinin family protein
MAQTWRWHPASTAIAGFGLAGLCLTSIPSFAQIAPDQTLGNESSIVLPNATVRGLSAELIQGGATRGVNLFHSFSQFNVRDGQRVYFANPVGIETILSRVTGADPSRILGTLGVNGTANLFLINPNGILFGPNARLDVAGSFLASTAASFKFPDGSEFSATHPQAPPMLMVNVPLGLQYGRPIGDISHAGNLSVAPGQLLSLHGNTVTITGTLAAPGGEVRVLGDRISLLTPTHINVSSSQGGGTILIGGDYQGKGTIPTAFRTFIAPGVTLAADGLSATSNSRSTDAHGRSPLPLASNGGKVIIWGNEVTGFYGQISARGGSELGNGGFVEVSGKEHLRFNGFVDVSAVHGQVGTILLDPRNIVISNNLSSLGVAGSLPDILQGDFADTDITINATTLGNQAGAIVLEATNDITVTAGTFLNFVPGGSILFRADADNNGVGSFVMSPIDVIQTNGRALSISSATITAGTLYTFGVAGGALALSATGDIVVAGFVDTGGFTQRGGNITFTSTGGNITTTDLIRTDSFLTSGVGAIRFTAAGNINVQSLTSASRSGEPGGDIRIAAGASFTLTGGMNGFIDSSTFGTGSAGNVLIQANTVNLAEQRLITSATFGKGRAGNITIQANTVNLADRSEITSATFGTGRAGDITIQANTVNLADRSLINSATSGSGEAGDVIVRADSITSDNSTISSGTAGAGAAGDLTLQGRSINLTNGAFILAGTVSTGQGGNVTIAASDTLNMSGTSATGNYSQVATNTFGTGDAGNVTIAAGQLVLRDGALIASTTGQVTTPGAPAGQGGNVTVNADLVDIRGISLDGTSPTRLATSSFSPSKAGDLTVNTGQLLLQDGGILATSSFSSGRGGDLTVNASNSVIMDGYIDTVQGRVPSAMSADTFGNGLAGDLVINTRQLTVQNGAAVSVSTFGNGQGGNLMVNASSNVLLQGADPDGFRSGLYAQAFDQGNAGNLTVRSQDIQVRDQATITVASGSAADGKLATGTLRNLTGFIIGSRPAIGAAGTLTLDSTRLTLDNQGQLLASTDSGQGGNIDLTVRDILLMRRSSLISATAGTAQAGGDGGNITINTTFLVTAPLENNDIIANAFNGQGGRVNITAQGIYWFSLRSRDNLIRLLGTSDSSQLNPRRLPTNDISAISQNNPSLNGVVTLNTPDVDPSRGLSTLPVNLVDPSSRIDQKCARGSGFRRSSFVITGRGGLAENPLEPLHSGEGLANWVEVAPTGRREPRSQTQPNDREKAPAIATSPDSIVEAQGWVQEADGTIALIAYTPMQFSPTIGCDRPNVTRKDR